MRLAFDALLEQTLSPLAISVGGATVDNRPGDSDRDGFNEGGGFYQLVRAGNSSDPIDILFEGADGSAETVAFRIANADALPVAIELDGSPLGVGGDYLEQLESNGDLWLFIRASIAFGSVMEIDF